MRAGALDWVAHASRVLAIASRHRGLSSKRSRGMVRSILAGDFRISKVHFGATPKPARETRALPTDANHDG